MRAFQKFALRLTVAGMGFALTHVAGVARAGTLDIHVLADGKALDDAVVSAMPTAGALPLFKSGVKQTIMQQSQQFSPFVLPVQVGTTVEFPNHDPFRHHVYSFSPAKVFELKLYGGGESQEVTFDKEGAVALGCNIHDNMLAYVYVVGTPYFAKTASGAGTITLPAGNYVLKVWHPNQRGTTTTQAVEVLATGSKDVTFNIDLKRGRSQRPRGAVDEGIY